MKEATIEAKQGGERGITARSVKKVTAVSAGFSWSFSNYACAIRADSLRYHEIGLSCEVQGMSSLLGRRVEDRVETSGSRGHYLTTGDRAHQRAAPGSIRTKLGLQGLCFAAPQPEGGD